MKDLSIYIHIPFCVQKCLYCDFLSFAVPQGFGNGQSGKIESYVNRLRQEINRQALRYRGHRVITVFIGGGTPSLLSEEQIDTILQQIRKDYHLDMAAEITIEMNPGTVTEKKLRGYKAAGINRVSIGLQSADDDELTRIGRIHNYDAFLKTYDLARKTGFWNINIDLMSALPGQNLYSYRKTLESVVGLDPEHISAYSLILEEGTPLYERRKDFSFPTEEEELEMYLFTRSYLKEHGYKRYEISNYAKEGYECRHNKIYWQRGDYAGFGLGASSMVENVRWSNPDDFAQYAGFVQGQDVEMPVRQPLSVQEQMEEFMFLGLRMTNGVNTNDFYREFGRTVEEIYGEVLDRLRRQKLLYCDAHGIRLTEKGLDVSNYAMAQFLFDR